jgi:chromosome segregation ATPase
MPDISTCPSCGVQREELAKRASDAEAQLALLRESNASLEKRVDWADRRRDALAATTTALNRAEREILKMRPVYDAAMDHYRNQVKSGVQAAMFAACGKAEPK